MGGAGGELHLVHEEYRGAPPSPVTSVAGPLIQGHTWGLISLLRDGRPFCSDLRAASWRQQERREIQGLKVRVSQFERSQARHGCHLAPPLSFSLSKEHLFVSSWGPEEDPGAETTGQAWPQKTPQGCVSVAPGLLCFSLCSPGS